MENGDLEHGELDMIQKSVERFTNCLKREDNHPNQISPSIYMAPTILRDLSPSSFNPEVVSIGPLHREDKSVQAFEKHKGTFLTKLMSRMDSPQEEILKSCMEKAYASMEQIKACYIWTKTYDDAEIAHMMVMDACFILEFVYWYLEHDETYTYPGIMLQPEIMMYDLVLLENQIPFFFLDEIYQCTISKNYPEDTLIDFIYPLLNDLSFFDTDIEIEDFPINTTHHILSILHQCYKPRDNIIPIDSNPSRIHSAVDLERAGVNFKPHHDTTWMLAMEVEPEPYWFPSLFGYWSKPTLTMPVLNVDDSTELVFRNLIAYEQSCPTRNRNHVTSYALAMDILVNTPVDVAKLVEAKVIINDMGSNEEAASMFNNICKRVVWIDFFYIQQWLTLYQYCNSYWPKKIAWLRRTYFSSPWNMIALIAGIILFALTVVQTIYTV